MVGNLYIYYSKKSIKHLILVLIILKQKECTALIIKKGHGYFRKSKAYGLSSCIVLGTTLLLGTGVVSAQETTAKTDVKTEQVAKQETKTNNTESTKDDSNAKLLEAIKKAKENHVIVELTKDVNYKTANEAKVDIDG
ncbi:MAG: hypothetical protein D8H99_44265 [Streptococcus sp.]|nr:MAG: hypothetical protein D8H99_44265 [Streptococcus sp.]